MATILMTKNMVDEVFEKATNQWEYLNALYEIVVGDETNISEYPCATKILSDYIFTKAIEFDKEHHPGILAGGLWMNRGFSCSRVCNNPEDWSVTYGP